MAVMLHLVVSNFDRHGIRCWRSLHSEEARSPALGKQTTLV